MMQRFIWTMSMLGVILVGCIIWANVEGRMNLMMVGGGEPVSGDGYVGYEDVCSNAIIGSTAGGTPDGYYNTITASTSGTISYMHISENSGMSTSSRFRMAIFENSDGSFVAQTGCFAGSGSTDTQIDVALESSAEITQGTDYDLLIISATDTNYEINASGNGVGQLDYDNDMVGYSGSPSCPDTMGSVTLADDGDDLTRTMCIWADNSSS